MRCPKCGYISFDDLEVCKKCHKDIAGTVQEMNGTAFHALAPLFLQTAAPHSPRGQFAATDIDSGARGPDFDGSGEGALTGADAEFVLDDISFDDGPSVAIDKETAEADKEITLDMDGLDEVAPRDEFTLDLDADRDKGEVQMPAIDFGDLDISDLGPPAAEKIRPPEDEPIQIRLEEPEPEVAKAAPKIEPGQESPLEDLQYHDLNLEAPAKFVAGSAAGKRYLPSVKTGTALDNFDINLGDLFAETTEAKK